MEFSEYNGQKLEPNEIAFPAGVKIDNSCSKGSLITMPDGSLWHFKMLLPPDKNKFVPEFHKTYTFDELLKSVGMQL